MNVLILDEQTFQIESLSRGLRSKGHEVLVALSAREAVEHLLDADRRIDLIITDYVLSIPDAGDLTDLVRKRRDISVIMMTACGERDHIANPFVQLTSVFIEKPFTLDQLDREIQKLEMSSLRRLREAASDAGGR